MTVSKNSAEDRPIVKFSSDRSRTLRWLTIGSILPLMGWLYGAALLWRNHSWSTKDKWIGTLLFPFGLWGAFGSAIFLALNSRSLCVTETIGSTDGLGGTVLSSTHAHRCVTEGPLVPGLALSMLILIVLATLGGPLYLAVRGREVKTNLRTAHPFKRRRRITQPALRDPSRNPDGGDPRR